MGNDDDGGGDGDVRSSQNWKLLWWRDTLKKKKILTKTASCRCFFFTFSTQKLKVKHLFFFLHHLFFPFTGETWMNAHSLPLFQPLERPKFVPRSSYDSSMIDDRSFPRKQDVKLRRRYEKKWGARTGFCSCTALHCTVPHPTPQKKGGPKIRSCDPFFLLLLLLLWCFAQNWNCFCLCRRGREREREKERERERESLLPFYNACAHWSCTTTTVRSLHALLQPLSGATYFEQCCQLILKKNAQKHNALVFFSCSFFYVIRLPLFLSTTVRYFFGLFQVFIQWCSSKMRKIYALRKICF